MAKRDDRSRYCYQTESGESIQPGQDRPNSVSSNFFIGTRWVDLTWAYPVSQTDVMSWPCSQLNEPNRAVQDEPGSMTRGMPISSRACKARGWANWPNLPQSRGHMRWSPKLNYFPPFISMLNFWTCSYSCVRLLSIETRFWLKIIESYNV